MPRMPRLSIELLDTLTTVIHQDGDAAAAAQVLKINQPSMSKRLAILQHAGDLIRHPWVERSGKKWRLTEEGRSVWAAVEDITHRYRQLVEFLESGQPPGEGVTVACGQHSINTFVREAVARFVREHADTRLNVATMPARKRILRVASGAADFAVVTASEGQVRRLAKRTLHVQELGVDPFVLAVSPLAAANVREAVASLGTGPATLEDLTRFPLIVPEQETSFQTRLRRSLQRTGLLHRIDFRVETGHWSTILGYVNDGLGVGLLAKSVIPAHSDLKIVPLSESEFPSTRTALVCRYAAGSSEELHLSDAARTLYEMLIAAACGAVNGPGVNSHSSNGYPYIASRSKTIAEKGPRSDRFESL